MALSPLRGASRPIVLHLDGESDEGSDLGDDLLMDDVFLEEVDRIERSAVSQRASQSSTTAPRDVIVIEDSEQEENGPVLNRRVRRRTGDTMPPSQAPSADDIIEILSDTD
jgi:hypothetical protein